MEETKLTHFKSRLEAELKELESELETVGRKNPANPSDWEPMPTDKNTEDEADPNDVADKLESFGENVSILRELEIRLAEIKASLEKITQGKFGICSVCNEAIETERLEANPAATTCKAHMNA